VSVDLGTGDGRAPWMWAREEPRRFFIGVDANAAGLREYSGRAFRAGVANLVYVRAAIEALPPELAGVADEVTAILPWGSLLAALARPSRELLRGIRALGRSGATLTVVLGSDPIRDQAEMLRLGVPALQAARLATEIEAGYRDAGFALGSVRTMPVTELARWPSTWARRLAYGRDRSFLRIDARVRTLPAASPLGAGAG
jgi:16S rRNA (adenine(1408)-N(1))-methyltransferase